MGVGITLLIMNKAWRDPLSIFFERLIKAGEAYILHPYELVESEVDNRAYYKGDDIYYLLVEDSCILAYGFLRGWDEGYDVPSLGIIVHPDYRGRGLGRLMMHALHTAARFKGAKRIRLKVDPANYVAISLYASLGYRFSRPEGDRMLGAVEL